MKRRCVRGAATLVALACLAAIPVRAGEVIEEVVAKVNDDVITKSELETREQAVLAELYRTYTGAELDQKVAEAKKLMLRRMIDDKILLHRAARMFDMSKVGDSYLKYFKEQQQIKDDAELQRLLTAEGMTVDDLKQRLVEMSAPGEVVRYEVNDRIAVGDKEVDAYYAEHPEEFAVPAEAEVREIVVLARDDDRDAKRKAAEEVREKAAAPGADFAAIAGESSDAGTKSNGGLLGEIKKGDLSPELEQVAFTIPVGSVGPVIERPYGFHILKVDERSDAHQKPLEEVREDVRKQLLEARYQVAYREFMKKAWAEATVVVMPKYEDRLNEATQ